MKTLLLALAILVGFNLVPAKTANIPIKLSEPVATVQTVAQPVTTTVIPVVQAPIPVNIKTEAEQTILGFGLDETQVICFNNIIDHFYGWNLSETEMLLRLNNVHTMYYSYCVAWNYLRNYPVSYPSPVGFN